MQGDIAEDPHKQGTTGMKEAIYSLKFPMMSPYSIILAVFYL